MNQSCHFRGVTLVYASVRTVGTAHLSTPSTRLSPDPFLPLPLSLPSLSPRLPTSPTTKPHPQPGMTWREYDLTTHSEILAQRPPPPLTRTCTRKHQLFHSPLSCPCPPPHTLHTRSVPFPHSSPPNLLLILHSLQHSCQAVMFFLASPTQCSHRFPLPLHTATSHTPWAQLTH